MKETANTQLPVCPYCYSDHMDVTDLLASGCYTVSCEKCGKLFEVRSHEETVFTTERREEADNA